MSCLGMGSNMDSSFRNLEVNNPGARSLSLATAYQASDPTKAAYITLTIECTATQSLAIGQTCTGEVRTGPTNAVASGGGMVVAQYKNAVGGSLSLGNLNITNMNTVSILLPAGHYFSIIQTAGSGMQVTLTADQAVK